MTIQSDDILGPEIPHFEYLMVNRGSFHGYPDYVEVIGEHGHLRVLAMVHPSGPLHPRSTTEAKNHPWWYTSSPFGGQIIALAWERNAEEMRNHHEKRN